EQTPSTSAEELLSGDFLCAICLDVFSSPVTRMCGHNFCKSCITENWRINRKCQCPVCKKHFDTSHELHIHTFVSEMATKFQQSAGRTASEETKPRDVPCDICTGVKFKALKSCLVCVASYREAQLEQHQMVPSLKRHNLFEPLINLEDRMCKKHDELKELFCKIVQVCVCRVCAESDHESHDIVPLIEECEEKMAELEETDAGFQQMIQDRQLKMQELWDSAQLSHKALVETDLTRLVEHINKKQKKKHRGTSRALRQELNQGISKLVKRKSEVMELSQCDNHFQLLQILSSKAASKPTKNWMRVCLQQLSHEGTVARAVAQLKATLNKEMKKLLEAELQRVQQYAVDVILDPDSAHRKLFLSDDGKQVSHRDIKQNLPDNPGRFSYCTIVLGDF
uniref:RING-type domain-containing protein n=1 Tax=Mola mola TaxID=94237 RepID=A0A3Q3WY51_MOLML